MRKLMWLCCALFWACTGSGGAALVSDAGPAVGARVGRMPASDARLADVVRTVGDARVLVDVLATDVARAADVAIPVADVAPLLDGVRFVDVVAQDARAVADVQPWGRLDDAGLLHCSSGYIQVARTDTSKHEDAGTAECPYSRSSPSGGANCRRDLTGTLPASCRWDTVVTSWTWYVRECSDCLGLESWDKLDGGAL